MGETLGFFLVTAGELILLRLGVLQSSEWGFELWDPSDEESSSTSPPMADRQLWSVLLKRLMHSADDSVLSTETGTQRKASCYGIFLIPKPEQGVAVSES